MKKALPLITMLALSLGTANFVQANEHEASTCPHKKFYKSFKKAKKAAFLKILKDNGVSDDTAENILKDLKELKMKIKHKIKHVLKEHVNADHAE